MRCSIFKKLNWNTLPPKLATWHPTSSPTLTLSRASTAADRVQLHIRFLSGACILTYNAQYFSNISTNCFSCI
jgi:hypothetical protein